jgi:aspartate/methionine/tyrosine aminotransferase
MTVDKVKIRMRFSNLVERVSGEGARAWGIYSRAREMQRAGRDVINLCIGDPDFDAPEIATEAAVKALRSGDSHYADIPGRPALRQAIADQFSAQTGLGLTGSNVIFMAGAQNSLYAVCQCLFQAGDTVIVPEPMYVTYEATVQGSGATIVRVPQPAARGFHIDLDALERAVGPTTRGIMFATPSNPTGAVMTRAELETIADLAKKHDLWVVADEVYGALTYDVEHISIASLPGMIDRTATVSSLAKSHAMPGFRAGWAIGPVDLISHMETLSLSMLYGLPGFVQEAALVAITQGAADVARMKAAYRRRRDAVVAALSRVQSLRIGVPEGGMFVLVDVQATGLNAQQFAEQLLEETGVGILPADAFGPSAQGHLRICYGLDDAKLTDACARITAFCERRQSP